MARTWRMAERMAGAGWFIVGDAAATLDPTSSHGVLKALLSGMTAGHDCSQSRQQGPGDRNLQWPILPGSQHVSRLMLHAFAPFIATSARRASLDSNLNSSALIGAGVGFPSCLVAGRLRSAALGAQIRTRLRDTEAPPRPL